LIESQFENSDKRIHTTEDKIEYLSFDHMLQHAKMIATLCLDIRHIAVGSDNLLNERSKSLIDVVDNNTQFENSDKRIHTTEDKIEYLSFDHMLQHAKMSLAFAYELAFAMIRACIATLCLDIRHIAVGSDNLLNERSKSLIDHASASRYGYPSAFVIESQFENSDKRIHTTEDKMVYHMKRRNII
jgi:hypothetical protein